ncbi:MAG: lamin tail domain-containing protein [Myxococcota bacterium]
MSRFNRLSLLVLLAAPACGDDVTSDTDAGSTGGGTTTAAIPMEPSTTTIDPSTSGSSSTSAETVDPDTGSSSTGDGDTDSTTAGEDDTGSTSTGEAETGSTSTGAAEDCGNEMLDEGEDCEGDDLAGATCESLGFLSGDLACAKNCSFDTSACVSCGDDAVDVGEVCDGADLNGADCTSIGMGFTGGALACAADCAAYDTMGCTDFAAPMTGEVIISEIMSNPDVIPDADGEWFELHNPSADTTYQLAGCEISGVKGEDVIMLDVDLTIEPGGYLTFAPASEADIGFVPDYEYDENYFIANGGDIISLRCDGMVIDTVDYNGFPLEGGVSLNLDPDFFNATDNDLVASWCGGTMEYVADNAGTPGAANTECVEAVTYDIGFCRLQFPPSIDETVGTDVDVFGRLYVEGLTDMTTGNDLADEVSGQVGYGPDASDPAVDAGWTWIDAVPNAGYPGLGAEANNDEYQASLTVPTPGEYDYAFRFSGDSGLTYTYCDLNGSDDGYAASDAGQMTSNSAGGVFELYFSEYVEGSSNNKAVEVYNDGAADVDLSACSVNFYFNGNTTPGNEIALSGTLAAGDVFVVCDDAFSSPELCDLLDDGSFYNGDDAIELSCDGTVLDVIGLIGEDPGAEWSAGGVGTQNETIRRNCDADADPDGTDAFDPSIQWTSFAQDSFDDLGQYICE